MKLYIFLFFRLVAVSQYIDKASVNMSKVLRGQDMRTTFMIRNIPNKYTQAHLLELVEQTHRGEFDFFYLRMDFRNR